MLPTDGGRSHELASRALAADGGFRFDLGDEAGDELSPFFLRKMLPAG